MQVFEPEIAFILKHAAKVYNVLNYLKVKM